MRARPSPARREGEPRNAPGAVAGEAPTGRRGGSVTASLAAASLVAGLAACAGGAASSGPRLAEPAEVAATVRTAGPRAPHRVRISWEYTDERGPVSGDGVLRFNPADSLRLDLFGPGGGSMSVALAGAGLRSVGQIRDVRVPPPPFLYASAGIFRPGSRAPDEGYRSDGADVLVYPGPAGGELRFHVAGGRLRRVEEVRDGRVLRRAELTWAEEASVWPSSAEYRDRTEGSRARWTIEEVRVAVEPFPREIFDLPHATDAR